MKVHELVTLLEGLLSPEDEVLIKVDGKRLKISGVNYGPPLKGSDDPFATQINAYPNKKGH